MGRSNYLNLRLRFIRESLGLTQERFAEKAGISYKYYQAIENGLKEDLRLSTLKKLSRACNLTLAEFVDDRLSKTKVAEIAMKYQVTKRAAKRSPKKKK
ncbi:MAG: helix-turn-helix transcriptional regulator [Verrucomicrobiota bacterium]